MVRRDLADLFCTKAEGYRARPAKKMNLIDGSFPRSKWDDGINGVAKDIAAALPARTQQGITLGNIDPTITESGVFMYKYVEVALDYESRTAKITVHGPTDTAPDNIAELASQGADTWGMRVYRELEDALLRLRFNHPTIGLLLFHTRGDREAILAHDHVLHSAQGEWFADELIWYRGRVLRRLDNMAKSMFAIIDEGSAFVGTLFEITLGCDRSYMMEDEDGEVQVQLNDASAGLYPMSTGITRLRCRFMGEPSRADNALSEGGAIDAPDADDLALVTMALDDIDWEDEIRIAIEERVSLSPDALTGMEQNLRFVGAENCETKIYGRLTAWQNWIFQRPNAVGDQGALTLYGHPEMPAFDWNRT
jgi:benzoyl-CoA-dihydrodiol lyase